MITGKIRAWPKGSNFSNQFCQIHITINEELFLFNGYMDDNAVSNFNILMASHWEGIQLVTMTNHDPRKMAQEELDAWANTKNVTAYKTQIIFLTQLKLELISLSKEENNKSTLSDDLEQEI